MRAKLHDQRKGQWLINKIRTGMTLPEITKGMDINEVDRRLTKMIELRLWNMENDVFDNLMEDYNK